MIKRLMICLLVYIILTTVTPLRLIRVYKRWLADLVFMQWSKMLLLSARLYSALYKNGNGPEDLSKYLDGYNREDD